MKADFNISDSGTIIFLTPVTERGKNWIDDNLELEEWQGSDRIPIEPRMMQDIKAGIILAGLKIEYI